MARITWKRYDPSDMHRLLLAATDEQRAQDAAVADDGWVAAQALFCPYYATLDGQLGSDWGVILNPESVKFGRLVFEHEWCGCPVQVGSPLRDILTVHDQGDQATDEWALPRSQQKNWRAVKRLKKKRAAV